MLERKRKKEARRRELKRQKKRGEKERDFVTISLERCAEHLLCRSLHFFAYARFKIVPRDSAVPKRARLAKELRTNT